MPPAYHLSYTRRMADLHSQLPCETLRSGSYKVREPQPVSCDSLGDEGPPIPGKGSLKDRTLRNGTSGARLTAKAYRPSQSLGLHTADDVRRVRERRQLCRVVPFLMPAFQTAKFQQMLGLVLIMIGKTTQAPFCRSAPFGLGTQNPRNLQ